MRRGPPAAEARVLPDVLRSVRPLGIQHRPEEPVRPGEWAHRGDLVPAHSGGDELGEVAVAVRNAERGVTGPGELARRVHDPLEDGLHRALGGDAPHSLSHGRERDARPVFHCSETLGVVALRNWYNRFTGYVGSAG